MTTKTDDGPRYHNKPSLEGHDLLKKTHQKKVFDSY